VTAIDNEKDDDRRNEKFKRMTQVAEAFVAFHKVYEGQETKSKKDTQQSS
jgi:CRISPR/Cas system CSM-associated protein Csm2 small subunit